MMRPLTRHPDRRSGGFTLIELLTVIAIISILLTIALVVGARVTQGGNERATQSVLISLDRALDAYVAENDAPPPYVPDQYIDVPGPNADLTGPYQGSMHPRRPDSAVFVAQVQGLVDAGAIIDGLPDRFRFPTPSPVNTGPFGGGGIVSAEVPTIVDAWADSSWERPYDLADQSAILYVHPDNFLAQDLYGQCVNGRPYFVSAGSDRLYGLTDDAYIPEPADGSGASTGVHTYDTCLEAQKDNLFSYDGVKPLSISAFDRTVAEGVR